MALYTFILDYAGGTYIRQVKATNLPSAIKKWATGLDIKYIKGIGAKAKELLIHDVVDYKIYALKGLINAWCMGGLVRNKMAWINIVKTEAS